MVMLYREMVEELRKTANNLTLDNRSSSRDSNPEALEDEACGVITIPL
jgi:hypothetical protein